MMGETPSISNTFYSSSSNSAGALGVPIGTVLGNTGGTQNLTLGAIGVDYMGGIGAGRPSNFELFAELARRKQEQEAVSQATPWGVNREPQQKEETQMAEAAKRRLVKVIIADPNENVPLDQAVLYRGEEKLTDLTNQELFFEIDIKAIIEAHNEKRVKITDRKVKERVEYLEPIKVRDLKMVVVTVAEF